jgi:RimJ/RimL family protein N-acetyltransferase
LKRLVAQTTADNPRMLALFEKRGYAVEPDEEGLMKVEKGL